VELRGGFPRLSERVEPEEFSRRVSSKLGELTSEVEVRFGQVWTKVPRESLVEAVRILKEDSDIACDYFTFLSAIDWQEEGFEVLVALYSTGYLSTVGIKVSISKEDPRVPSITDVFRGADWHERECSEMFGIEFEGHPNLTHLYLPTDFEGHPLLKSFRLASRTYKPWPGAKDPGERESGGRS
jgi:NADH-quinone oxidoreductase subunit C